MASKVEILGGQLDGSVLSNAASESTLRELVDAIKKLESSANRSGKSSTSGGKKSVDIDTDPANDSLKSMSTGVNRAGKLLTTSFGGISKGLTSAAGGLSKSLLNMTGLMASGSNNLSGFVGALGMIPGPMGKLASSIAAGVRVLESYQAEQRKATMVGASFNNSMMEMRIAAARSGMALSEYGDFVRANAQSIGGLGDTITDGAKKLAEVGEAVGKSGLDVEFMKLGYSSIEARKQAMKFSTELVKSDRVRSSSARELASASLGYEKDLDLLAKQTGKSKDELRAFSESLIKRGGALQFAFSRMSPQVQASLKSVMNTVGATMGQGTQDMLADMLSGAAAPSSEASAMFQAQMPGVVQAFKEMKDVANDTSISEAERKVKVDGLMAKAQAEQLTFLQSEQGKFLMENKTRISPAQRAFIEGLEANAKSLSEQGIDISTATRADIERVTAAKRAEQERQAELDKGFNAFQAVITRISTAIQTTFFSILSPILEKLAGGLTSVIEGFNGIGTALEDMGIAVETITPVVNFISDMLGVVLGTAFETMASLVDRVWQGFQTLIKPIQDLFAAFGFLGVDTNSLIDGFSSLIDIVNTVFVIIKDVLGGAFDFLFQMIGTMISAITDIVNVFKTMFEPQITWVSNRIKEFGEYIMNIGPEILNGIRAIFSKDGAKAVVDGARSMLQSATGSLLSSISDILPDWAGGKKLAETAQGMLEASEQSRQAFAENRAAALDQAGQRAETVKQEIDSKNAQTAQLTANVKQNLETGKRELAARREREKAEAESADRRKQTEKDKQIADAMERARQAAIKRMQELAGITPGTAGTTGAAEPIPVIPGTGTVSDGLGKMSEKYETGGRGSGTVGWDSTGGTSYGKYQIASKVGAMTDFLKFAEQSGRGDVAAKLRAAGAEKDTGSTSGKSVDVWKQMAASGELGDLEHQFIKKRSFDPAMAGLKDQDLKKMIEGNKGLQEMMWSTAVQHGGGGASGILNQVYKQGMKPEELVKAVYAERGTRFGSSTQQVQASVRNRFGREQGDVMAMLGMPATTQTATAQPTPPATTQTATAQPKPPAPAQTTPTSATVVAATAPPATTAQQTNTDKTEQERLAAEQSARQASANAPQTAQDPMAVLIADLNSTMAAVARLQGQAVSIAEQQLRATKGLSRDAYTAV